MREFEREFLIQLAAFWLGCRLASMGGTPGMPQHKPVTDFYQLGWSMLGEYDYAREMRLVCQEKLAK